MEVSTLGEQDQPGGPSSSQLAGCDAAEYGVPLDRGVPALAILGSNGKLIYAQRNGEEESARSLDPDGVVAFLNKWKPQ